MWKAKVIRLALSVALAGVGAFCFHKTQGVGLLACLPALLIGSLLSLGYLLELAGGLVWAGFSFRLPARLSLLLASVFFPILVFEGYLEYLASQKAPSQPDQPDLAMPRGWQMRPAEVAGAAEAHYWHGHLHVYNADRLRHVGPFPPRQEGIFRILAVGDSLTYGYGIAEEDTWCRLVERKLRERYRVEVLNLGRCGAQSADILKTLEAKLPLLEPDLVVYGVCLNDFLHSGVNQYEHRPLKIRFRGQRRLLEKTEIGPFLARKYDDILMRLGFRDDFYHDILRDFDGYRTRFARDVKAMNAAVRGDGLPPMVAMVLDQGPERGGGDELTAFAEGYLKEAGMEVVPADYRRTKGKQVWHVSAWEGHPNETANRVFSEAFLPAIEKTPALQKYQHATLANRP